mmetsp:Transcript_32939/g.75344  ORF Transcript_32939/g.75344 Transcript_32939/m.75344 type:complete len:207 (-) Transcript_32939:57-677(-)
MDNKQGAVGKRPSPKVQRTELYQFAVRCCFAPRTHHGTLHADQLGKHVHMLQGPGQLLSSLVAVRAGAIHTDTSCHSGNLINNASGACRVVLQLFIPDETEGKVESSWRQVLAKPLDGFLKPFRKQAKRNGIDLLAVKLVQFVLDKVKNVVAQKLPLSHPALLGGPKHMQHRQVCGFGGPDGVKDSVGHLVYHCGILGGVVDRIWR